MRERGTGSLWLRGGVYWAVYSLRGRKIRVSTKTSNAKKAKKFLDQRVAEVKTDTHLDTSRIKYEDLRAAYYADYVTAKRKSLNIKDGLPHLDKVARLDSFFSGYKANEIKKPDIQKFIAEQRAQGYSDGSIIRSLAALKRMFNLALEDDVLRYVPKFPKLKEPPARHGFMERGEYDRLFAELPDYLRLPVAIGFFTGMREGEILGLTWDQVDIPRYSMISLKAEDTKTDTARKAPIIPELRTLLIDAHAKKQAECEFICYQLDHEKKARPILAMRKAWHSACIRAGLGKWVPVVDAEGKPVMRAPKGPRSKPRQKREYDGLIFHDLRRSGVRNLVRAGVPELTAMKISGHKSRAVFDRYNISSEKDLLDAGRKLAEYQENQVAEVGAQFVHTLPMPTTKTQ
jgi:integrase